MEDWTRINSLHLLEISDSTGWIIWMDNLHHGWPYRGYGFLIRNLIWFGTEYGFWLEILIGTEFGTEFQWEKNRDPFREPFIFPIFARYRKKSVSVRILTYRNPYYVPYQVWLRTHFRIKYPTEKIRTENPYHVPYQKISYQKSVPRTKIRIGTDFRYGSVVHDLHIFFSSLTLFYGNM